VEGMTGLLFALWHLVYAWTLVGVAVLTIYVASVLNRVTGGGYVTGPDDGTGRWWGSEHLGLSGKPVLWTAPVFGLLAFPWIGWQLAVALAFAFLAFRLPPWGQWFDMGRLPWRASRNWFETAITSISLGSKRLAMFWRLLITSPGIVPLAWLICPTIPFIAAMVVGSAIALWLAYELGWRLNPITGISTCEKLAGGVWGLFIIGIAIWTY